MQESKDNALQELAIETKGLCSEIHKLAKQLKSTETLQEAAEKYADEKTNKFSFGWDKEKAGRQLGFISGATHQAPITKAETIENIRQSLKKAIDICNSMKYNIELGMIHFDNEDDETFLPELIDLLTQIKNI